MGKYCDMHVHSVYSDGADKPAAIIDKAVSTGLSAIALCDHNTIGGVELFQYFAEGRDIDAVAGVEVSTKYGGGEEFHIQGLFIPEEHLSELDNYLLGYFELKKKSNLDLIEGLVREGYNIEYDTIRRKTVDGNVNRVHIANELIEKGYFKTRKECFDGVLSEEYGLYKQAGYFDTIDVIRKLREFRTVPVLAHPLVSTDREFLINILPSLIDAGLIGIEIDYPEYTDGDTVFLKKTASDFGLVCSGGSDYHGANKPNLIGVGTNGLMPYSYYEELKKMSEKIRKSV